MSWFVGVPVSFGPATPELPPSASELTVIGEADRHVTLVFLGQAREDDARAVWDATPTVPLPSSARALAWQRFGRTAIALALSDEDGELERAADACHEAAHGLIVVRHPTPFRPHVTVARVPRRARPPGAQALRGWPLPPSRLLLGPLTLYTSRNDRGADRYVRVEERREAR